MHEDTPLYFKVHTNRVTLPGDDEMVALYHWTVDTLSDHGFDRYELSNFAKPGYESRHNTVYWERKPYKAFGLGACSFDGERRFQNDKNLMNYLEGIEKGGEVVSFSEELSAAQIQLEKLMLGLRRKVGVSCADLFDHFSQKQKDHFEKTVHRFKEKKLLVEQDGKLLLTTDGMVVENEIIAQLSQ